MHRTPLNLSHWDLDVTGPFGFCFGDSMNLIRAIFRDMGTLPVAIAPKKMPSPPLTAYASSRRSEVS